MWTAKPLARSGLTLVALLVLPCLCVQAQEEDFNNARQAHDRRDYDTAIRLFERSLRARKAVYGPGHLQVGYNLTWLGHALTNKGQHTEALDAYKQADAIYTRQLPATHSERAWSDFNLGKSHYRLQDYARSRDAVAASAQRFRVLRPEDPNKWTKSLVDAMWWLGDTQTMLGDFVEAGQTFEQMRKLSEAQFGESDPLTARCLAAVGGHLADSLGQKELGELKLRQALQTLKSNPSSTRSQLARTQLTLGWLYHHLGQYERAKDFLVAALDESRRSDGERDLTTASVRHSLAIACTRLGEYEQSEGHLLQCIKTRKELMGDRHFFTVDAGIELAHVYLAAGKVSEAAKYLEAASEVFDSAPRFYFCLK